jgi:SAM-dependent methyltransferase
MDILGLNKKAWDRIGEKAAYPYIKHKKYAESFDYFCRKLPADASVLDLGCGPGLPVTKALIDKGFRVTAVDLSDTMIELAKKNVPNARYIRDSMTDIDFSREFDGVVSSYSMLCLNPKDFRKAAGKIAKSLKKGGLFLLVLNEPPPGRKPKEEENIEEILGQRMYSRAYTEKEIREIFLALGMEIMQVERETVVSEQYGKEFCLIVLMQKK